jgi:2-phospho-L-lactate guanylyltransferase
VHHRPLAVSPNGAADNSVRRWSVIVPVKELHAAKSRLNRPDRADIALAMARDTVRAAAAATAVAEVVVVTDDPRALQAAREQV